MNHVKLNYRHILPVSFGFNLSREHRNELYSRTYERNISVSFPSILVHICSRVCEVTESKNIPEHPPNSFFVVRKMQGRHHFEIYLGDSHRHSYKIHPGAENK